MRLRKQWRAETAARTLCYEMSPMARRFAIREEPSATPLIDIQGCKRSNRERSDEAALSHLGGHALKVLRMKSQNLLLKLSIQNPEAAA